VDEKKKGKPCAHPFGQRLNGERGRRWWAAAKVSQTQEKRHARSNTSQNGPLFTAVPICSCLFLLLFPTPPLLFHPIFISHFLDPLKIS